jgi:hypothetical protein
MSKKIKRWLAAALVATNVLAGTACNSNVEQLPGDSMPGESIIQVDQNIRLSKVKLNSARNNPGCFDEEIAYKLSKAVCNELNEYSRSISNKEPFVSRSIEPNILSALFFKESSWRFCPDESKKNDNFAGVGQISKKGIMDALSKIKDNYNAMSKETRVALENNIYMQIYNNYELGSCEDLAGVAEKIFIQLENGGEENVKLGAALSAMCLQSIGASNWKKGTMICDNKLMVLMQYYCGSGNIGDYINAGIIVVENAGTFNESNKVTFNLNNVNKLSGYEDEVFDSESSYGIFVCGLTYAIGVLNMSKVMADPYDNKASRCEKINKSIPPNNNITTNILKDNANSSGQNVVFYGDIREFVMD